ncbi:caspase family protein [Alsobacter metallidurans]|uniref:caspase family protein n=1 Tax=Alsobacter metallidurans TaxID=340221 RepID=UPI0016637272|nr:caspase family protein [Alsobacter metallidurans]
MAVLSTVVFGAPLGAQEAALSEKALCESSAVQREKAVPACTHLIEGAADAQTAAGYLNNRAIAFAQIGMTDDAIADLNAAIAKNPVFVDAIKNRGLLLVRKNELDRAIADFNAALKLAPTRLDIVNLRGAALQSKQEFNLSVADFNKILLKEPKNYAALVNRSLSFYYMRKLDEAIKDLNAAIVLQPDATKAYQNRALALSDKGRYADAISDATYILSKTPNDVEALSVRADAWRLSGNLAKAKDDADAAVAIAPDDARTRNVRALVLRDGGDLEGALADLDAAILQDPRFDVALANRGDVQQKLGASERARADLDKAIAINPGNPVALAYRGNLYRERGEYELALADYNRTLKVVPDFAEGIVGRGLVHEARHEIDLARADYLKATKLPSALDGDRTRLSQSVARQRLEVLAKLEEIKRNEEAAQLTIKKSPEPVAARPDPGRRVALVIGNGAYRDVPALPNPKSDANLVAETLKSIGFQLVTVRTDQDRASMLAALRDFAAEADKADWAIIYYAGHGIQLNGVNYTIPTDAMLKNDRDVPDETISLDRLLTTVDGAKKLKLVILDACRDNPFASRMARTVATRSVSRGLARLEDVQGGVLVAYAARDGQVASDGNQRNSPFVQSLVRRIQEPNTEINMVFRRVRDDVLKTTSGRQEPWVYGSLSGSEYYFK